MKKFEKFDVFKTSKKHQKNTFFRLFEKRQNYENFGQKLQILVKNWVFGEPQICILGGG